jgi:hypothetical protein
MKAINNPTTLSIKSVFYFFYFIGLYTAFERPLPSFDSKSATYKPSIEFMR